MRKPHALLEQQIEKYFGQEPPPALGEFLHAVDQAYRQFDQERTQLEGLMGQHDSELLVANEDLRKVNAELDRFVYSVSHDLRAPIASVLGLIQIARHEQDPVEQQRYFTLMQNSLQRLDSFIHDIIDYSRNNRLERQPELIQFDELIEEVASSLRYMPDAHTVELLKEISIDTAFYTDRQRLKVILTNLIGNAVRYHNPRQPSPYILFSVETNDTHAYLRIKDNGIGIGEIYLPRIFDMFFRAHQESKGSGLGLYIVKEMVKKLEGDIRVQSTQGEGTTFTITLPNLKPALEVPY